MLVDDLVKQPGAWLSMTHDTGVVISSRLRLARNIKNAAFPEWAGEDECVRLCNDLRGVVAGTASLNDSLFLDMGALDIVEKELLKERHLISNDLADKGKGSGVIVSQDETIAIMINEEDHLRLQAISPGMALPAVWEKINTIDTELEKHLDYAFSDTLGYLTACPSNVGTGLRASVMLHLSGLRLLNEIEPVVKGMNRIGLAVRGLLGEGTEAYGNMFQVSNESTLGETEQEIVDGLVRVIGEVVMHEQNARARLMDGRKTYVLDQIWRSYGILTHALMLSSKEAVDFLSILRLGVELGLVNGLAVSRINEIMLLTQPAHLQKSVKKNLSPEERDEARAAMVKRRLGNITIQDKKS